MVFITEDTWKDNGVEVIIVDNIKWLNEWNAQEQLGHSTLRNITLKYPKHLRKQRQELRNCLKQPCIRFLRKGFAVQIIMDCRTVSAVIFKSRLGFKQQDPIMTQEQSVLTKLREAFSTEEIIFQHCALGYRIDAYFLKYKLAIEVDEQGHRGRDFECDREKQKALEGGLGGKFIRINPAKENFSIFNEISKIHNKIVKSDRKSLLKRIYDRLLGLEFKLDNSITTKCLKWVVKNVFPEFNN